MHLLNALILGIVQGVTEFLPISSSGHLSIAQNLFGLGTGEEDVFFDVLLHLGTLVAVFAAVYLDGGIEQARELIERVLLSRAPAAEERRDYKTTLQEVVQRRSGQVLTYHMLSQSGPDHNKTFLFEVRLNGAPVGQGEGRSKKEAEQAAAKDALAHRQL